MITEIPPIPAIPEELVLAARQGRLVPFIGAGVSQLAGCPGWGDFANQALDHVAREGGINHAVLHAIRGMNLSPRVRLALALQWAQHHGVTIDFEAILHPDRWETHADGVRIYQALTRISKHFVTTNYDLWLDSFLPTASSAIAEAAEQPATSLRISRECIYQPQSILISALDRADTDTVVHLHGSVTDPSSMVLTTAHYIDRYADRGPIADTTTANAVQVFLQELFRLKNLLFIGYSLDELELLEYVILQAKRDRRTGETDARHFILQPFFSHEVELANGIAAYFRDECGVALLPFLRDHKNYAQLVDVLESFARDLEASPLLDAERRYVMERLLDD